MSSVTVTSASTPASFGTMTVECWQSTTVGDAPANYPVE